MTRWKNETLISQTIEEMRCTRSTAKALLFVETMEDRARSMVHEPNWKFECSNGDEFKSFRCAESAGRWLRGILDRRKAEENLRVIFIGSRRKQGRA